MRPYNQFYGHIFLSERNLESMFEFGQFTSSMDQGFVKIKANCFFLGGGGILFLLPLFENLFKKIEVSKMLHKMDPR